MQGYQMLSRRLNIGVLDLLSGEATGGAAHPYSLFYRVMPQVVAAFSRPEFRGPLRSSIEGV